MNQKSTLTIRTEALREFLTFHLDRADEAVWVMERKLDSTSPEGINAHLNAVNDAARSNCDNLSLLRFLLCLTR